MKSVQRVALAVLLAFLITNSAAFSQYAREEKFKLAQSYEKSGDVTNASRIYKELYDANPEYEGYFQGVVRTYKALNKWDDLRKIVEEHLKLYANYKNYALAGELNWRAGFRDAAAEAWGKAISVAKDSVNAYMAVAEAQASLRLFDKAILVLKNGRSNLDSPLLFSDELSELYIAIGDYVEGTDEVLTAYRNNKNEGTALGRLYALMTTPKAQDHIIDKLKKAADDDTHDYYIQDLFASILREVKRYDEALEVTKRLDVLKNSQGRDILYFADRSRYDGQYDVALKAYGLLIDMGKKNPFFPTALFGYARTLESKIQIDPNFSKKELDDIIYQYTNIIDEYPDQQYAADSYLRLAVLYHQFMGLDDKAENYLTLLIKKFPYMPVAASGMNLLGDIYISKNQLVQADSIFTGVIKKYGRTAKAEGDKAEYRLAEINYYRGNIDTARADFQAISQKPNSDVANDALEKYILLEQNKSLTQALKLFAEAELLLKQKKPDEAISLFMDVSKKAEGESLADKAMIEASKIELSRSNFIRVRETINDLLQKNPDTIYGDLAYLLLARSFEQDGKSETAIENYTQILVKYPQSIYLQEARDKIRKLRGEKF